MLLQDYGGRLLFGVPLYRRQLAFGFDWATGGEDWTFKFLGQEYTLAVDNFEFSPAIFVYTDRAEWETALGQAVAVEHFEADAPGAHQTPYTTAGGAT